MKKRTIAIVMLTLLLGATLSWAQTNVASTNTPPLVSGSGVNVPLSSIPGWLQLLITPVTLALAAAIKKWLPKVPVGWLPFIVPFIGAGIDVGTNLFGVWGAQGLVSSAVAGGVLGGLSTWVHQLSKQAGGDASDPTQS